ncbi:aldehyde dehydrogenase family protein [Leucobacter sp. GX24907]
MVEGRGAERGGAAERAAAIVAEWATELHRRTPKGGHGADLMIGAHGDTDSVEFLHRLLDLVFETDDAVVAADGLRDLSRELPESLALRDRAVARTAGAVSLGLPWAVMPLARRWLRERVSHLLLATRVPNGTGLGAAVRRFRSRGIAPQIEVRGETPHGPQGARRELDRLVALAARAHVDRLIVDPARLVPVSPMPGGDGWSAHEDTEQLVEALRTLLEACLAHDTALSLEPRDYRFALLAPEALLRALGDARFDSVRAGLLLPTEMPESTEALDRLRRWARMRARDGGAPLEAVIGPAHMLGRERIASLLSGLPVPVLDSRAAVDAHALRLMREALRSGSALRPVLASDDPLLIAAVLDDARAAGVSEMPVVRLRAGVAPAFAGMLAAWSGDAARSGGAARAGAGEEPSAPGSTDAGEGADTESPVAPVPSEVRVHLPITPPDEFSGALSTVVELAAEVADPASSLARLDAVLAAESASTEISAETSAETSAGEGESERESEISALREAILLSDEPAPPSHRTQLRSQEWNPSERDSGLFYRSPDDPAPFDTGGLTAAVLGLVRGETGEVRLEELEPQRSIPVVSQSGFANEPGTDALLPENREWASALLRRAAAHRAGVTGSGATAADEGTGETAAAYETDAAEPASAAHPDDPADAASALESAHRAQKAWSAQLHSTRATRLRRASLGAAAARDRLTESLAADTGRPIAEIDAEIGDIIDAGRYAAQLVDGLAAVRGAEFVPGGTALIVADAVAPVSQQAGRVLTALAAGSTVIWAVPDSVRHTAGVLLEEWEGAGLTRGVVTLVPRALAGTLARDVDRALVVGLRSSGRELARVRPDLRVEGWFVSCGAIVVTPSADEDDAVRDIIASAFRGAGADPQAAHAVILVGGTGRSRSFQTKLADAVRALRVGDTAVAHEPGAQNAADGVGDEYGGEAEQSTGPLSFDVGPLATHPHADGLRALTELGRGEEWLVAPRQLDDTGRLWAPGVRLGVAPDAPFWEQSHGLPVLGIARARTFTEALALQRRVGGGSVAGLQSLNSHEILAWLDEANAASLVVNSATCRPRVERRPAGGWGREGVGLSALSGGPNQLVALGSWRVREGTRSTTLHLRGLEPEVRLLIEAAQESLDYEQFDAVRRAALADALTWRTTLGVVEDTIGLGVERNALRHRPVPTALRLSETAPVAQLLRVIAAALLVRAPFTVSTGKVLPDAVANLLAKQGIEVSLERDSDWVERLALPATAGGIPEERVRLIGGDRVRVAEWMGGQDRALWAEPVTMAGPVELLSLLREQSITVRAHRHGVASPVLEVDEWLDSLGH